MLNLIQALDTQFPFLFSYNIEDTLYRRCLYLLICKAPCHLYNKMVYLYQPSKFVLYYRLTALINHLSVVLFHHLIVLNNDLQRYNKDLLAFDHLLILQSLFLYKMVYHFQQIHL